MSNCSRDWRHRIEGDKRMQVVRHENGEAHEPGVGVIAAADRLEDGRTYLRSAQLVRASGRAAQSQEVQ